MHKFEESLARAKPHEERLDAYLKSLGYTLKEAEMDDQRIGIDRWATQDDWKSSYSFEYKCDSRAAQTKNAYIETLSNSSNGAPGWVHTCQAFRILYYVVPEYVIWLKPDTLRHCLDQWAESYRTAIADNPGYYSQGLLVPLNVLKMVAEKIEAL